MRAILFHLLGLAAAVSAQDQIPSPQQDLCDMWPQSDWAGDNVNWPANLTDPGDAPPPSTAGFVCGTTSCVGNQGIQSQLTGYGGNYGVADSVMILVQSGARLDTRNSRIWKQGATSIAPWLNDQGYNAAIDVLDGAVLTLRDTAVICNNGAMGIFARGPGTSAMITDAKFYSTGYGAWGITSIAGANTQIQSAILCANGINSPAFAGSGLTISYSSAHTWGYGSPIIYARGNATISHTTGSTNSSAAVIVDGPYLVFLDHCDMTANMLAGAVLYSSSTRSAATFLTMAYGSLAVADNIPCFLVANAVGYISVEGVSLTPPSSALVWVDVGILTEDLSQYVASNMSFPGQAFVTASQSLLRGYAIVGPMCLVSINLNKGTSWTGAVQYRAGSSGGVDVSIDSTSIWYPSQGANIRALSIENGDFSRIGCTGQNVSYYSTDARNSWLASRTVPIPGCTRDAQTWIIPRAFQGPVAVIS